MQKSPQNRAILDAATARELLHQRHPDSEPEENSERDGKLWWILTHKTAFAANERSQRLAELHTQIIAMPENSAAHQERDKLLQQIEEEALAELQAMDEEIAAGTRAGYWLSDRTGHE